MQQIASFSQKTQIFLCGETTPSEGDDLPQTHPVQYEGDISLPTPHALWPSSDVAKYG